MPLPQKKLIPTFLLALVLAALAAPPLWWSQGNDPVIAPAAQENNHGPANIGQAKHMAKSALEALRPILPATANAIEADLVGEDKPIKNWNAPATQEEKDKNHAPLLIGQLKAIADPFYRHLHNAAPAWLKAERIANGTNDPGSIFPWTDDPSKINNRGIANIGQLKAVFSLRFNRVYDWDGDGLPNDWELAHGLDPHDNGVGNPANGAAGIFPGGGGITNIEAFNAGVLAIAGATPGDRDGDGLSNDDDSHPDDPLRNDQPWLMGYSTISGFREKKDSDGDVKWHGFHYSAVPDFAGFNSEGSGGISMAEMVTIHAGLATPPEESWVRYGEDEYGSRPIENINEYLTVHPFLIGEPFSNDFLSYHLPTDLAQVLEGIPSAITSINGNLPFVETYSFYGLYRPRGYIQAMTLRIGNTAPSTTGNVPRPERKIKFLKLVLERPVPNDESYLGTSQSLDDWTPVPDESEPVEMKIDEGQTLSEPYYLSAPAASGKQRLALLLPVDIAVDANRDGEITFDGKDETTAEKPYRFWINNDQDDVEADEPIIISENDRDLLDTTIKTKRDLEDFTRIQISVGLPLDQLKKGSWKIGLKFKDIGGQNPAIRIWPNESDTGGKTYLTDGTTAQRQISKQPFGDTISGTVFLPASYWTDRSNTKAHLIFEGIKRGSGELVLVVKKDGQSEIAAASLHMKLLDVREMFQRARIHNPASEILDPWVDDSPIAQSWEWNPWNWPHSEDPDAAKTTAVFVHGWRLTYDTYLNWAQTSYKRLWHQGFKGKFYTFRWATFSGDSNQLPPNVDRYFEEETKFPPGGFTYNASEYRAWLCGPALASWVNGLPNAGRRSLFAHSMGNVISGAALRAGMSVQHYALCNAAMSSMAYDPGSGLKIDPSTGEPWDKIWGDFYLGPEKTPDTDTTATIRNSYGLENKFSFGNSAPRMVNFYLREDAAMKSWVLNNLIFKPDDIGHNYYYQHTPIAPNISYKIFQAPLVGNPREVTSQSEAFGYITKSLTRPLGSEPRTGGSIESAVNMDDWGVGANHWGFTETHSAQWRWSNHSTNLFWEKICAELELIE